MNVLIDIGHPAHVHLFKNFAWIMEKRGHTLFFTCRQKEYEMEMLRTYGFKFKSFGKKYQSRFGKILGMMEFDFKEYIAGLRFKPDLFLSHGSIYAAHASFLLQKPHISLEDTFNFEQIRIYLPFTYEVLTGKYEHPSLGKKEIQISSYHELAYLHPRYFIPDRSILQQMGIRDEKYIIVRFVALSATHDYGQNGISLDYKMFAVKEFSKYAKVFISSESELPAELKEYRINIPPHKMHDAMAFASLLFGESSTMAEESAMLGVPSIYINDKSTFYTKHLERDYNILYNYSESTIDQSSAIDKGLELLEQNNIFEWEKRREKMFEKTIDINSFLVWFVEHYPRSGVIMRKNPEYQYQFKN